MRICPSCGRSIEGEAWSCGSCGWSAELRGGFPLLAPELAPEEGYAPEAFEQLAELEQQSFWFRSRNRLILWAIARYFPAARSMLEVGCGNGFVLSGVERARPGMRLAGGEPATEALATARTRLPDAELLQLDARRLPFREEFDLVGAFDVIEHIEEDEQAIASLRDAARPGGGILITVPQHPRLWAPIDDFGQHRRRYTRRGLLGKLRAAGIEVLRATSFVSLPLPALAYSRARQRRRMGSFDPMEELRISPRLDSVLERVLGAERALIRRGLSFPAGGSLLAVGLRR